MTPPRITEDWINDPKAQAVCKMLTDAGHAAHFVGGCVRNALMNVPVTDLDISTDARPDRVAELARAAGFDPVPTGVDHGTMTVVVDHAPFEITTWRRDVETDGRRAVVAFADTLEEDAHRRDFTMNALYAAPDGRVLDPLGGYADLTARRVRFIDEATDRIREDYLRILRFFRFHAWYGDPEGGLDAEALAAIAANSAGIDTLSRERVGQEMVKLLGAPDPAPSVATMGLTGVLAHVVEGLEPKALPLLVHFEQSLGLAADPMRRLAVLGGQDHRERLRLSKAQDRQLTRLLELRGTMAPPAEIAYRHGARVAWDVAALNAALLEMPPPADLATQIDTGAKARFPVTAQDLVPAYSGAALGARLAALEDHWIASGFTADRETLLEMP